MAKMENKTKPTESSSRPLDGIAVGISVANSEDLDQLGYTVDDVNRVTVRLSEALLSAGARLVFGHDWRRDGIMAAISRIAVKHQPSGQCTSEPMIQNLLPWPTEPMLDAEVRADLEKRGLIKIEQIGLPECQWTSPTDLIARAIALTHLRRELARRTQARVCIGGKEKSSQGFYAGIIEEAWTAAADKQPLYVASFLGGASARLVEAIQNTQKADSIAALKPIAAVYNPAASAAPELVPPKDLFNGFDPDQLQQNSGLDPDDWTRLLGASDVAPFAALVIRGLSQRPPKAASASRKSAEPSKRGPRSTSKKRTTKKRGSSS